MSIRRLEADQGKASEENQRFAFVVAGHDATLRPSFVKHPGHLRGKEYERF